MVCTSWGSILCEFFWIMVLVWFCFHNLLAKKNKAETLSQLLTLLLLHYLQRLGETRALRCLQHGKLPFFSHLTEYNYICSCIPLKKTGNTIWNEENRLVSCLCPHSICLMQLGDLAAKELIPKRSFVPLRHWKAGQSAGQRWCFWPLFLATT